MKLYFSDPTSRPAINIHRLGRLTYNIRDIVLSVPSEIDTLIILGNGSPEDEIAGILAWHQKTDKIVGIVKPDRHHVDAFRTTKSYFTSLKVECLLFIIDQDQFPLDELFDSIESVIKEQGIAVTSSQLLAGSDRVKTYECTLAGKAFKTIAVISGLPDFNSPVHVIEDHLLKLAGIISAPNAKEVWVQLPKDKKEAIMTSLKERRTVMEAFPQHFTAFSTI
ncbi:MAG: hypothetical protein ABSG33_04645 [Candidatus Bathyarchaeia archaeon]|jgi:hypothetical protein